jgi:hypothetical protein
MPNGGLSKQDHDELEQFFAPLAPSLTAFGLKHGLKLTRYHRGSFSWDFLFLHPRGGLGQIVVRCHEGERVQIHSTWWRDDYAARTRYVRSDSEPPGEPLPEVVLGGVSRALRRILAWDNLIDAHRGYDGWARTSETEFYALEEAGLRLPVVDCL